MRVNTIYTVPYLRSYDHFHKNYHCFDTCLNVKTFLSLLSYLSFYRVYWIFYPAQREV